MPNKIRQPVYWQTFCYTYVASYQLSVTTKLLPFILCNFLLESIIRTLSIVIIVPAIRFHAIVRVESNSPELNDPVYGTSLPI